MTAHTCERDRTCMCYVLALEPNEDCPKHGFPWPPRCACGRFVSMGVPDLDTPYPATERDEDSEMEYAREDAPLLQEDRR